MLFHYGNCKRTISDLEKQVAKLKYENCTLNNSVSDLKEFIKNLEQIHAQKCNDMKINYEHQIALLQKEISALKNNKPKKVVAKDSTHNPKQVEKLMDTVEPVLKKLSDT